MARIMRRSVKCLQELNEDGGWHRTRIHGVNASGRGAAHRRPALCGASMTQVEWAVGGRTKIAQTGNPYDSHCSIFGCDNNRLRFAQSAEGLGET